MSPEPSMHLLARVAAQMHMQDYAGTAGTSTEVAPIATRTTTSTQAAIRAMEAEV